MGKILKNTRVKATKTAEMKKAASAPKERIVRTRNPKVSMRKTTMKRLETRISTVQTSNKVKP